MSVIIPTYNRAGFILQSIRSVFSQTYDQFEILVVDDGSTDNTRTLIEPLLRDQRLRYFRQSNQGPSVARNLGLKHAKGEFVCFLDSDDWWVPDKLKKSIEAFHIHPEVDIVYGDRIVVDEASQELHRINMPRYSGKITRYLLRDNCISMLTTMVKRRCFEELGGFDDSSDVVEDYELWLRFSSRYMFLYLPGYLAYYRVMREQLSTDKDKRFELNWNTIQKFHQRFPDAVSARIRREGWCYYYMRRGRYYAETGFIKKASRCYIIALRYSPITLAPWRAIARLVLWKS